MSFKKWFGLSHGRAIQKLPEARSSICTSRKVGEFVPVWQGVGEGGRRVGGEGCFWMKGGPGGRLGQGLGWDHGSPCQFLTPASPCPEHPYTGCSDLWP